ncbi:hypothetical protein CJY_0025 [Vibrio phage CJY]|uniref:Hydrolase n=1 Tax=Vibrio phage JSF15 TaxID=1983598 RepID=A0A2D0Z4D9_9CAUD|nr:hypothetical protein CJY_0025 [Vibrio phage CJY]AIZ01520.1 hypothetical protein H2_0025 [Vibrio phage H2 SGB-2014]ASV42805.1 hydrolase [Vibrio phage JSF15]ASV43062.1 hydrolase [Vibrio phage JSF33]
MMQIQNILRAGHVPRWQLCDTTRTQSIAEHMFNVAMIARHMCAHIGITGDEMNEIVMQALTHDMDEVILGDMPTVTKQRLREAGIEPNGLIDCTETIIEDPLAKQLIKIADLVEAAWWIDEHGIGRHAERVAEITRHRLFSMLNNAKIDKILTSAGFDAWERIKHGELLI